MRDAQNMCALTEVGTVLQQKNISCVKMSENDTVKPLWHQHFYQNLIMPCINLTIALDHLRDLVYK